MSFIVTHIRWIMLASGLLTLTMLQAFVFPVATMQSTFGETPSTPAELLVVRNWGALIAIVGVMLIWGAFRPALRRPFLLVAGSSKLVFIALVLAQGSRYLTHQAGTAIAVDAVAVLLFAIYLIAAPDGA